MCVSEAAPELEAHKKKGDKCWQRRLGGELTYLLPKLKIGFKCCATPFAHVTSVQWAYQVLYLKKIIRRKKTKAFVPAFFPLVELLVFYSFISKRITNLNK